jgi:hypothetical protein
MPAGKNITNHESRLAFLRAVYAANRVAAWAFDVSAFY